MSGIVILGCIVPPRGLNAPVDILLLDGRIVAITPAGEVAFPADVEVIAADGLVAVPGLTNAHTHTPMSLMKGAAEDISVESWFNERVWPMEMNLTPERVLIGARLACAEMLLSGVTAFADHYFFAEQIARAARELGIRASIAPTFFSRDTDHDREAAFDAARAIQGAGSGLVTAHIGPHAPYTVNDDDLRAAANIARELGVRVHIHASENMKQTVSSLDKRGATPIQVLSETGILDAGVLIAHGAGIVDDDRALLVAHAATTGVACCPKVYFKHDIDPMTPVKMLRELGVAVGAGTDGAAGSNTLDVWESMRLTALAQKRQQHDATFLPVIDAFELATEGGARAIGNRDGGVLEPGALADLVLVDVGGPHCQPIHDLYATLVYSVRASDVVTVLVGGDVVVRDRKLVRADLAEIIEDARRVAPELVKSVQGEAVQHYDP